MRLLFALFMLASSSALAQSLLRQPPPKGVSLEPPAFARPETFIEAPSLTLNRPPPETPIYSGPFTDDEKVLIVNALERQKKELAADPKTVDASDGAEMRLGLDWHGGMQDRTLLPTIGLALSRATNVEIDRIDENGVSVIDNAASRAASKPYCDLLKKLNPLAGCTQW